MITIASKNKDTKQESRRSLAIGLTGMFYFGSRLYLLYRLAKQEILKDKKNNE